MLRCQEALKGLSTISRTQRYSHASQTVSARLISTIKSSSNNKSSKRQPTNQSSASRTSIQPEADQLNDHDFSDLFDDSIQVPAPRSKRGQEAKQEESVEQKQQVEVAEVQVEKVSSKDEKDVLGKGVLRHVPVLATNKQAILDAKPKKAYSPVTKKEFEYALTPDSFHRHWEDMNREDLVILLRHVDHIQKLPRGIRFKTLYKYAALDKPGAFGSEFDPYRSWYQDADEYLLEWVDQNYERDMRQLLKLGQLRHEREKFQTQSPWSDAAAQIEQVTEERSQRRAQDEEKFASVIDDSEIEGEIIAWKTRIHRRIIIRDFQSFSQNLKSLVSSVSSSSSLSAESVKQFKNLVVESSTLSKNWDQVIQSTQHSEMMQEIMEVLKASTNISDVTLWSQSLKEVCESLDMMIQQVLDEEATIPSTLQRKLKSKAYQYFAPRQLATQASQQSESQNSSAIDLTFFRIKKSTEKIELKDVELALYHLEKASSQIQSTKHNQFTQYIMNKVKAELQTNKNQNDILYKSLYHLCVSRLSNVEDRLKQEMKERVGDDEEALATVSSFSSLTIDDVLNHDKYNQQLLYNMYDKYISKQQHSSEDVEFIHVRLQELSSLSEYFQVQLRQDKQIYDKLMAFSQAYTEFRRQYSTSLSSGPVVDPLQLQDGVAAATPVAPTTPSAPMFSTAAASFELLPEPLKLKAQELKLTQSEYESQEQFMKTYQTRQLVYQELTDLITSLTSEYNKFQQQHQQQVEQHHPLKVTQQEFEQELSNLQSMIQLRLTILSSLPSSSTTSSLIQRYQQFSTALQSKSTRLRNKYQQSLATLNNNNNNNNNYSVVENYVSQWCDMKDDMTSRLSSLDSEVVDQRIIRFIVNYSSIQQNLVTLSRRQSQLSSIVTSSLPAHLQKSIQSVSSVIESLSNQYQSLNNTMQSWLNDVSTLSTQLSSLPTLLKDVIILNQQFNTVEAEAANIKFQVESFVSSQQSQKLGQVAVETTSTSLVKRLIELEASFSNIINTNNLAQPVVSITRSLKKNVDTAVESANKSDKKQSSQVETKQQEEESKDEEDEISLLNQAKREMADRRHELEEQEHKRQLRQADALIFQDNLNSLNADMYLASEKELELLDFIDRMHDNPDDPEVLKHVDQLEDSSQIKVPEDVDIDVEDLEFDVPATKLEKQELEKALARRRQIAEQLESTKSVDDLIADPDNDYIMLQKQLDEILLEQSKPDEEIRYHRPKTSYLDIGGMDWLSNDVHRLANQIRAKQEAENMMATRRATRAANAAAAVEGVDQEEEEEMDEVGVEKAKKGSNIKASGSGIAGASVDDLEEDLLPDHLPPLTAERVEAMLRVGLKQDMDPYKLNPQYHKDKLTQIDKTVASLLVNLTMPQEFDSIMDQVNKATSDNHLLVAGTFSQLYRHPITGLRKSIKETLSYLEDNSDVVNYLTFDQSNQTKQIPYVEFDANKVDVDGKQQDINTNDMYGTDIDRSLLLHEFELLLSDYQQLTQTKQILQQQIKQETNVEQQQKLTQKLNQLYKDMQSYSSQLAEIMIQHNLTNTGLATISTNDHVNDTVYVDPSQQSSSSSSSSSSEETTDVMTESLMNIHLDSTQLKQLESLIPTSVYSSLPSNPTVSQVLNVLKDKDQNNVQTFQSLASSFLPTTNMAYVGTVPRVKQSTGVHEVDTEENESVERHDDSWYKEVEESIERQSSGNRISPEAADDIPRELKPYQVDAPQTLGVLEHPYYLRDKLQHQQWKEMPDSDPILTSDWNLRDPNYKFGDDEADIIQQAMYPDLWDITVGTPATSVDLDTATERTMFLLHWSDSLTYTPRVLSRTFKLSLHKTKIILKKWAIAHYVQTHPNFWLWLARARGRLRPGQYKKAEDLEDPYDFSTFRDRPLIMDAAEHLQQTHQAGTMSRLSVKVIDKDGKIAPLLDDLKQQNTESYQLSLAGVPQHELKLMSRLEKVNRDLQQKLQEIQQQYATTGTVATSGSGSGSVSASASGVVAVSGASNATVYGRMFGTSDASDAVLESTSVDPARLTSLDALTRLQQEYKYIDDLERSRALDKREFERSPAYSFENALREAMAQSVHAFNDPMNPQGDFIPGLVNYYLPERTQWDEDDTRGDYEGDVDHEVEYAIGDPEYTPWRRERPEIYMGTDHDLIRTKMMEQRRAERFMRRTQAIEKHEQDMYQKDGPLGTTPPPRQAPQVLDRRVQARSRWNFVLTDISEIANSRFSVAVRDADGSMREPTTREYHGIRNREKNKRSDFNLVRFPLQGLDPIYNVSSSAKRQ